MSFVLHGLIVLTYLGVSLAVALALPQAIPAIGSEVAMFAAGGILIVSTLLHQGLTHAAQVGRFTVELQALKASGVALRNELRGARGELKELAERPMMAADPLTAADDDPSDESQAANGVLGRRELDLLRTLFSQLPRAAESAPAANDQADEVEPFLLSGGMDGRLAAVGGAAAPTMRAANARRNVTDESDYRRHLVVGGSESIPAGPSDAAVLAATRDALERARVTLFVQPIVSLPNRRTKFYETYSRIRATDGEMIGPERYLRVASDAGLIAAIDNNLLFRCVQLMRRLRKHERTYGFFCNVSPHTVSDDTFFPQFVEFLGNNVELAGEIVFEFTQADIESHYPAIAPGLGELQRLGYRFSLDQLTRFDLNMKALADRHFRYIKLDTRKMLELRADPEGRRRIERLLNEARDAGIAPIVEKIETERDLIELLDFPFPYGQGYLFGAPKESRARE